MRGTIWVDNFGKFPVARKEMPRAAGVNAYFLNTHTRTGVLHTTEGLGMQAIWNSLHSHPGGPASPHLQLGINAEIWQLRPFDVQAAALRGAYANANAALQIEMEGWTGGGNRDNWKQHTMDAWDLPPLQREALIEIMVWAAGPPLDIPIVRANPNWRDDMKDMKGIWATPNNTRRMSNTFPKAPGWYGHGDIKNSDSGHYDPGALNWSGILADARALYAARTAKSIQTAHYVVQPGDGLYAVARRNGVSLDALLAANQFSGNETIHPGQSLVIPG